MIELTEHQKTLIAFAREQWPTKEEEATCDRMLKWLIAQSAIYLATDYPEDGSDEEKRIFFLELRAVQLSYGLIQALHKLREVNISVANQLATELWFASELGDYYDEMWWEWSIEHDVPVNPDSLKDFRGNQRTQEQAKAELLGGRYVRESAGTCAMKILAELPNIEGLKSGMKGPELGKQLLERTGLQMDELEAGKNDLLGSGSGLFTKDGLFFFSGIEAGRVVLPAQEEGN